MAIRKILTDKDPALHKKCHAVTQFDERLWELLDDMKEKNETAGYHSVAELREDIEVIETILNNGAHPAVLEKNFLNSGCLIFPDDFTEELLCDVE